MYRVRPLNSLSEIMPNHVYKLSQMQSRVINHSSDAIHLVPTKYLHKTIYPVFSPFILSDLAYLLNNIIGTMNSAATSM